MGIWRDVGHSYIQCEEANTGPKDIYLQPYSGNVRIGFNDATNLIVKSSISVGNADIRANNNKSAVFFPSDDYLRKIVFWQYTDDNDYNCFAIGTRITGTPSTRTMQFLVSGPGERFVFSGGNANHTGMVDYVQITDNGLTVLVGNVTSPSFNATSDIRLKHEITPIESQIRNIKEIKSFHFKWIKDDRDDYGFIAQDILKYYPKIVSTTMIDNEQYYTLDYSRLTTFLWKGLQEVIQITETQQREIDTLKLTVETQQQEIDTLKLTVETQQQEIDTLKQQMNAILAKLG
jgi:hypothetical protein